MTRKQLYFLVILASSLVIIAILFLTTGEGEKLIKRRAGVEEANLPMGAVEIPTQKITLFFLGEEDSLLHPEEREIRQTASVVEAARLVVNELLRGSQQGLISPFPPRVKLREIYLTDNGLAYVDFSRELSETHSLGATSEMMAVYAVVSSLTYNFKEIKKVFFLIDGRERETLSGHVNLRRPFTPLPELIASSDNKD